MLTMGPRVPGTRRGPDRQPACPHHPAAVPAVWVLRHGMADHHVILVGLAIILAVFTAAAFRARRRFCRQMRGRTIPADDGVYLWSRTGCPFCADMRRLHADAIAQGLLIVRDTVTHTTEAKTLGIRSVPTTLVVRAGHIVEVFVGVVSPARLAPFLTSPPSGMGDPS